MRTRPNYIGRLAGLNDVAHPTDSTLRQILHSKKWPRPMQEPCTKDIIDWLAEYRYQPMTWCASSKPGPSCYASSSARTGVRVPPPPARDTLLPPRRGKPRSHATRSSATPNEKSPDRVAGARILHGKSGEEVVNSRHSNPYACRLSVSTEQHAGNRPVLLSL